jgi:hypothetical protein
MDFSHFLRSPFIDRLEYTCDYYPMKTLLQKLTPVGAAFGLLAVGAFSGIGSSAAQAIDFSFTGAFANDASIQSFFFTANGASTVTFRSYSYAGGTNSAGQVIAAGGFDPILSLFDGADNLIDTVDDGPDPVPPDPVTGASFDTNFSEVLSAGNYRVVVSQYNNFASGPTFADGFPQSSPTFTSGFGCSNGQFCDVTTANRTNQWAFDIKGVDQAEVPWETDALPVVGSTVLFGFGIWAKRKWIQSKSAQKP